MLTTTTSSGTLLLEIWVSINNAAVGKSCLLLQFTDNKFRNQHVIMTIAVPVGKRIKIANQNWQQVNIKMQRSSIRTETINGIHDGWYDEWNEPWDGQSYSFEKGVEYKMTTEGLVKLKSDPILSNEEPEASPSNDAEMKLEELKKLSTNIILIYAHDALLI